MNARFSPVSFLRKIVEQLVVRQRSGRAFVLLLALLGSAAILLIARAPLQILEERLGSLGWTLSPDTAVEERITIVAIDEQSLAEVGPWPWSREIMAELSEKINQAGAQLQLHDITYAESMPGDAALAAVLSNSRGAVLAQVPLIQSDQSIRTGTLTHPVSGATCNGPFPATQNFVANNATFSSIPKGHISPLVASDGSIRQIPALICVDDNLYPALAISALLQVTNQADWRIEIEPSASMFGPDLTLSMPSYPGLNIPLDADGNLRISYAASPDSFQAISAVDVLRDNYPSELFDNTWVLVGTSAFGIGDIVPTPYSGAAPGVELQARLLSSLLDAAIPYTPRNADAFLWGLALVFAGLLFVLAGRGERSVAIALPVTGVLLPGVALSVHFYALGTSNLWLGWVFPALYGMTAAAALLLLELSRVRSERTRVYSNLHSYLPEQIAKDVAYNLPSSSINAQRRNVTLMSADLRNFSAYGEARPPEEAAAVLHFFFAKATEIIERHAGRLHEFKGDSLLAVWDDHSQHSAEQALAAAQEMQDLLSLELAAYAPAGLEPLDLGIGIEQGPVLMGSIGPAHRRTHTLLGETVTVTLRIQELTADISQPILLGECVARQLDEQDIESQGSFLLDGLRNPHVLYAPEIPKAHVAQRKPVQHGTPKLRIVSSTDS